MHGFVFAGLDKSWASSSKTSTDSTKASARPNPGGGFVANENFKRIYCMGRGEGRFDVAPTWVFILFFFTTGATVRLLDVVVSFLQVDRHLRKTKSFHGEKQTWTMYFCSTTGRDEVRI